MINIGIFGASGYTGFELVRILQRHPQVKIHFATSESAAGRSLAELLPGAPPLTLVPATQAPLKETDLVFLCLPHAAAAATACAALAAGCRVVDLSADFRLRDADVYAEWYGGVHPAPEMLAEAVYGLTEFARPELPTANLIANPGCYPTATLLGLRPLLAAGAVRGPVIVDAKSGVSGAGRKPAQNTHFVEVSNNFSPYKIGRVHRHLPEIEQVMRWWQPDAPAIVFAPHLLPVPRGILATIYLPWPAGYNLADLHDLYAAAYDGEPFVQLLPAGQLASLAHATHSNRCVISLTAAGDTLVIASAIDNLVKGAAGQAVQNMNVMYGFDETTALN